MNDTREKLQVITLTTLRISVGIVMAAHGWMKLSDPAATASAFRNMGVPAPEVSVYLAMAGEFLGGLGLIVGLLTPVAAFGILSTMTVAILVVHLPNGLMAKNGGFEYPLTLFMVALYFITRGGGPFSLDALLKARFGHSGGSKQMTGAGHREAQSTA